MLRLLKAAARHCFWRCSSVALDLAIRHLKLPRAGTVFAKLVTLLQELLGPLSDAQLLQLLNKRIKKADEAWMKAVLENEDLQNELSAEDRRILEDLCDYSYCSCDFWFK